MWAAALVPAVELVPAEVVSASPAVEVLVPVEVVSASVLVSAEVELAPVEEVSVQAEVYALRIRR